MKATDDLLAGLPDLSVALFKNGEEVDSGLGANADSGFVVSESILRVYQQGVCVPCLEFEEEWVKNLLR